MFLNKNLVHQESIKAIIIINVNNMKVKALQGHLPALLSNIQPNRLSIELIPLLKRLNEQP